MILLARFTCMFVALCLLGGCVETRFESPLGDNIETCDTQWKGLWVDPESRTEASAIFVDDECHFIVLDQPENTGPIKRIHVPMNYVHVDGKDYIVVADSSLKGLVELKPPYGIEPVPEKSFSSRATRSRRKLEVNQVDSERVAKLVIDGKIDGTRQQDGQRPARVRARKPHAHARDRAHPGHLPGEGDDPTCAQQADDR